MKSDWWTFGQAAQFLLSNVPCDAPWDAAELLRAKSDSGDVRMRYKDGREVAADKWRDADEHLEYERRSIEKLCKVLAFNGARRPAPVSFAIPDAPIVEEMHALIQSNPGMSGSRAALHFVDRAVGGGTTVSKQRRLQRGYKATYGK